MKLKFPEKKHKNAYKKLISEWSEVEEIEDTSPWALFYWNNFEEFLEKINLYRFNSPTWTNSTLLFLIDWSEIIWGIDIRHSIENDFLNEFWWHIWYGIAPKFRKKWYATKMLELALIEVKKIWLEKVLITCDITNIGSRKVIEKNWWIFERLTEDWKMNRFWLEL